MIHDFSDFHTAQTSEEPSVLKKLSCSYDATIRSYVAENIHTPLSVLENLAEDVSPNVCVYVLRNTSCTPEIMTKLMKHDDRLVKREANLLALKWYKLGKVELSQKELFHLIQSVDPTANNLDAIDALAMINEKVDEDRNA